MRRRSRRDSRYENFNCVGCHQHGGGGIGPALMDDQWIYGSSPKEIIRASARASNGMPAFRDKIPETQLWQLVSYVRALGGLVPSVRLPARTDHLQATPPLSMQERQAPTPGPGHPTRDRSRVDPASYGHLAPVGEARSSWPIIDGG